MSNPIPSQAPPYLSHPPQMTPPPGEWKEIKPVAQRRIYGIQPALFVGMCLLAIVSLVTVILIFTGDFESQAERVIWTVLVFLGFTGLLALDLNLSRKDSTPLVLGVAGNTYILAASMLVIWMSGDDRSWLGDSWLFGTIIMLFLVVRASVAAAWGLIVCGERSGNEFGKNTGRVAASLVGLAGFLLTFHQVMSVFDSEPTEFYWRSTVAVVVIAALASSITVLLFWNRRNLDWQESVASHGTPQAQPVASPVQQQAAPQAPQVPQAPQAQQAPQPAPVPAPVSPPQPQSAPQPAPQVDAQPTGGLLPWPRYADGTPYPSGPDGQPIFPRYQ